MFGGTGRPGAYQSIGFGQTSDAVYLPGFLTGGATGDLKLTEAYGIRGAFNHNWDPYWSTSLWGSYAAVRYNGDALDILSAKGQFCASFNLGKVASLQTIAATRTSTLPRSAWSPAGLPSRT